MDNKTPFKKYYSRLACEGIIKAILCGIIVGAAVNFVVAFATWFTEFNGLWLSLGLGVAALATSAPLFYFKLFKPTAKSIARRLDGLGLEERMITMNELENDESYIAMRQREDAMQKINSIDSSKIKFLIPAATIATACVIAVAGVSMTTVSALTSEGILPKPEEIINPPKPEDPEDPFAVPDYYEIIYQVSDTEGGLGGGYIEGEAEQVVLPGENGTAVKAVADTGWAFQYWDIDELDNPERIEKEVKENLIITAVFARVEPGEGGGGGDGDGEGGDQSEPGDNDEGGDNDKPSESEGNGMNGNGAGGGNDLTDDSIINGEIDYRELYDYYNDLANKELAENGEISEELRKLIESYLNMLK